MEWRRKEKVLAHDLQPACSPVAVHFLSSSPFDFRDGSHCPVQQLPPPLRTACLLPSGALVLSLTEKTMRPSGKGDGLHPSDPCDDGDQPNTPGGAPPPLDRVPSVHPTIPALLGRANILASIHTAILCFLFSFSTHTLAYDAISIFIY
jgi:hypothetical protein